MLASLEQKIYTSVYGLGYLFVVVCGGGSCFVTKRPVIFSPFSRNMSRTRRWHLVFPGAVFSRNAARPARGQPRPNSSIVSSIVFFARRGPALAPPQFGRTEPTTTAAGHERLVRFFVVAGLSLPCPGPAPFPFFFFRHSKRYLPACTTGYMQLVRYTVSPAGSSSMHARAA